MLRLHVLAIFVLLLITMSYISDVKSSKPHGFLLVVNKGEQSLGIIDPTSGQQVIDTTTNKVQIRVALPASAYGTASTRDGRWLLVALPTANKVAVVDLHTMKLAPTVDVPAAPQFVLVRPDNQVAYVSCDVSHKIAVINLSEWKVDQLIDAGKGADGLAWALR